MKRSDDSNRNRRPRAAARCALAIWIVFATSVQAQTPCIETPLQGLPDLAHAGDRVRITAELDSGCNYKVVDEATLVCSYPGGSETRHEISLFEPPRGPMQAEVVFEVSELDTDGEASCRVEFRQCNEVHHTCEVSLRLTGAIPAGPEDVVLPHPAPERPIRPRAPDRRPRVSSPPPPPPPPPAPGGPAPPRQPAPQRGADRDGGGLFRAVGWIGVLVGLGVYVDAGSKEEEGRIEESQESEELANQILAGSSVLLLLGYAMDGKGFVEEWKLESPRRVRPSLSIDPFHRAVMVRVSVRFD